MNIGQLESITMRRCSVQTIYADVLIILNIYVNFFLLRTTARITHSPLRSLRCAAASAYGSIFSLMILLPEMPWGLSVLIKCAVAVTIVIFAFGFRDLKRTAINTAAFFASNLILAGAVYAVYSWMRPEFIHFRNTYFYIDFSLVILVLSTAAMYGIVFLVNTMTNKDKCGDYNIIIRCGKRITKLKGLADTGNILTDFFTGRSVIICDTAQYTPITGMAYLSSCLPAGFRVLPCTTVSETGLIPIFRPDEVLIENACTGSSKKVDALIGFGKTCGEAVFNPKLLNY